MTSRVKREPGYVSPEKAILSRSRARAKAKGVPFSLTYLDIVIPDRCPILGMQLEQGLDGGLDNSPSLDRIVPKLGYVPGNVQVISNRANRIKSDSTPEELARILAWVLANTPKPKRPRRHHAKPAADHAPLVGPSDHVQRQQDP